MVPAVPVDDMEYVFVSTESAGVLELALVLELEVVLTPGVTVTVLVAGSLSIPPVIRSGTWLNIMSNALPAVEKPEPPVAQSAGASLTIDEHATPMSGAECMYACSQHICQPVI